MTRKYAPVSRFFIAAVGCFSINLIANPDVDFAKVEAEIHKESYPLRNIDRPSVMPVGTLNMDLNAGFTRLKTNEVNSKTIGADIGAKFGIVRELEGVISYDGLAYNINDNAKDKSIFKRTVNLGLKYHYLSIPHLSGSISAKVPLHILDGEIVRNIVLGVPVVLYTTHMAGGILGDVLDLTMRENIEAKLNFKVWYGYQFTDHLWAELNSSFGRIDVTNPKNQAEVVTTPFWKELPLDFSARYAFTNAFDVGANVGMNNILKAKESILFGLTLSYRAGRLFS